jgi:integrase
MSTTQPIRNTEQLKIFKSYYLSEKPNSRNYALIIIGLNSALRISDILRLTYGDVYDFERSLWKTHIVIAEQKTGKTNRIYMNREIQKTLKEFMNPDSKDSASWLFASQIQKTHPLSRFQAYRIVREAAAFAGLDANISCHSLRKTFGYYAWKQGTPPALLMSIYNHSAYRITKRYLGIDQDDKDEVFAKIKI